MPKQFLSGQILVYDQDKESIVLVEDDEEFQLISGIKDCDLGVQLFPKHEKIYLEEHFDDSQLNVYLFDLNHLKANPVLRFDLVQTSFEEFVEARTIFDNYVFLLLKPVSCTDQLTFRIIDISEKGQVYELLLPIDPIDEVEANVELFFNLDQLAIKIHDAEKVIQFYYYKFSTEKLTVNLIPLIPIENQTLEIEEKQLSLIRFPSF